MRFTVNPATPALPAPAQGKPQTTEAASIWMAGVIKPLAQNILGGVGVAVLGMAVLAGLVGLNPLLVGKASLISGAVVFGLASAVRAFADEIAFLIGAYAAGSIDATTEALRAENSRLLAEIERLKNDGMVAHAWGAREAAERLANDYCQAVARNQDVSKFLGREAAMARGMSRAQWEQGIQFLRNSGVLEQGLKGGIWTTVSEEAALAAIARHAATSRVSVRAANGDMTKL